MEDLTSSEDAILAGVIMAGPWARLYVFDGHDRSVLVAGRGPFWTSSAYTMLTLAIA